MSYHWQGSGHFQVDETWRTKAYPPIVRDLFSRMGSNSVTHHEPTPQNKLGQTAAAHIFDDIIDVVLNSKNEADAFRNLFRYFSDGGVK